MSLRFLESSCSLTERYGSGLNLEQEIELATTQTIDGIVDRMPRYGKAGLLDGIPYGGSGTKCFHLVSHGSGWRITSLAWVDENA